jgi:insulysin
VENAYNQYLAAHAGHSNAYTASTSTNYYFEVAASNNSNSKTASSTSLDLSVKEESPLYGALDRFAQFFIEPLFLEDTLDRELQAVDSENKKNLQSDTWRLNQLNKSLANPEHPYCHFSTGNYKTLHDDPLARGVKIRDEFIKFYKTHYSANRMKLAVLGRESLDELEGWVQELFSPIPDQNLPQNRWDHVAPLTERELGMQIFAKPVCETRSMDLTFAYRDEDERFASQPDRYLSHLIGHEGPGSIFALIKAKGWANGLSAGASSLCPGSGIFSITVRLTEEGLKQYREITKLIFQYISLLRDTPPQEWVVTELKRMSEVDFRFKQKSPASKTTSSYSSIMQKPYPRHQLLSSPLVLREFNPEGIKESLSFLRPDNFRMVIVSQDFPGDWDQKEKWYGTEYKTERLSKEFLDELKKAVQSTAKERPQELHFPHPNEFIPTRLEVERKEVERPARSPKLIRNDENVRIWWKKDDQFWAPKANIHVTLRTPLVDITPQHRVVAQIFAYLVNDALTEYSYAAELAGLSYNFFAHASGFDVSVSGYNDKMPVLLEKVLTTVRDLEIKEDRFNIITERLRRGYRNWDFQQPYIQVGTFTRWLNNEKGWINDQYSAELPLITCDDIRTAHRQLLGQLHIEVLAHGNVYKEDALKVTDTVEAILQPRKFPQSQWSLRRALRLPQGGNDVYKRVLKDPANVNHCIEYLLHAGESSDRSLHAKLGLLGQMTEEPVFDQLRTKEQLGYVVFSGAVVEHSLSECYRVLIQSERSPEYLESRIDSFLSQYETTLSEMDEEQFEKYKSSLVNKRLEKLKNLTSETNRFISHIMSERFDFEQGKTIWPEC